MPHILSPTAFHRTPKEVFALVFELIAEDHSIRNLRAICLVCRAWYTLAISLPSLWSFIPISRKVSPAKLALWIKRSRNQTLHVISPPPEPDMVTECGPIPDMDVVQDRLLQMVTRCGVLSMDCLNSDQADPRGLEWVGKLAGMTLHRMETFRLLLSTPGIEFPPTCVFPRLKSLTLGRGTAHWTSIILPLVSSTLASFTLLNIRSSGALSLQKLHQALDAVPNLKQLHLDEVEWAETTPNVKAPCSITLPALTYFSLTAVDDVFNLIRPLHLPKLVDLVIGDATGDLGPVFRDIARKSSVIQRLTTGLWDDEFAVESEKGLVALLEKQRLLRFLAVSNAQIDRVLLRRLAFAASRGKAKDRICPKLSTLELPARLANLDETRVILKSRSAAGVRLDSLTLVGRVRTNCDLKGMSLYVGRLKVEEGEEVE